MRKDRNNKDSDSYSRVKDRSHSRSRSNMEPNNISVVKRKSPFK